MHCGDQRHAGLCLGYVPALAYGSCRVSDQGTTLRASDLHNARATILNPFNSTSIRKNMVQNCSYFTQMKSTTTAIDDSNRRRNKLGLGCSREATAPLILIFKLLFLWLNIGRHFKGITQFHNCHSSKHTSKKYYLVINIFRKICTKIIT